MPYKDKEYARLARKYKYPTKVVCTRKLAAAIREVTGFTWAKCDQIVKVMNNAMRAGLERDGFVTIPHIGRLELVTVPPKKNIARIYAQRYVGPYTVITPRRRIVTFEPAKTMRRSMNTDGD